MVDDTIRAFKFRKLFDKVKALYRPFLITEDKTCSQLPTILFFVPTKKSALTAGAAVDEEL